MCATRVQISSCTLCPCQFQVGNVVRISKLKNKFEKGYTTNWTEEVFKIIKVQPTIPFTYKLEDTLGEVVKGTFYEPELQLAKSGTYRIKKVYSPLLPSNVRGLLIGQSNCGKTTLLLNMLLQSDWLDYDHLYVFGKTLHQQEYRVLKKGFEGRKFAVTEVNVLTANPNPFLA